MIIQTVHLWSHFHPSLPSPTLVKLATITTPPPALTPHTRKPIHYPPTAFKMVLFNIFNVICDVSKRRWRRLVPCLRSLVLIWSSLMQLPTAFCLFVRPVMDHMGRPPPIPRTHDFHRLPASHSQEQALRFALRHTMVIQVARPSR